MEASSGEHAALNVGLNAAVQRCWLRGDRVRPWQSFQPAATSLAPAEVS